MISVSSVTLEVTNNNSETNLLVIPGFSNDAYLSTVEHFKTIRSNVIIAKFNGVSDYAKQKVYIYEAGSKEKMRAETAMYKKLATVISKKIKPFKKITLIAKSAGAGVAWYLLQKKKISSVYLQAPGFSDVVSPSKPPKCDTLYLGWNKDDDKIKYSNLNNIYKFIRESVAKSSYATKLHKKSYLVGKHEWQPEFIQLVKQE